MLLNSLKAKQFFLIFSVKKLKSGKNPTNFFQPEPEPDFEARYPAGTGFSRIFGQFLLESLIICKKVSSCLSAQVRLCPALFRIL